MLQSLVEFFINIMYIHMFYYKLYTSVSLIDYREEYKMR